MCSDQAGSFIVAAKFTSCLLVLYFHKARHKKGPKLVHVVFLTLFTIFFKEILCSNLHVNFSHFLVFFFSRGGAEHLSVFKECLHCVLVQRRGCVQELKCHED